MESHPPPETRAKLFSSFPNSIWERDCPRNSVAALIARAWESAMELPQQVRSQIEFGNEGKPDNKKIKK
jgi:hypothetical protein